MEGFFERLGVAEGSEGIMLNLEDLKEMSAFRFRFDGVGIFV